MMKLPLLFSLATFARCSNVTVAARGGPLYVFFYNKWFFDELYAAIAKYTKLPPQVVAALPPPNLVVDVTPEQDAARLLQEFRGLDHDALPVREREVARMRIAQLNECHV